MDSDARPGGPCGPWDSRRLPAHPSYGTGITACLNRDSWTIARGLEKSKEWWGQLIILNVDSVRTIANRLYLLAACLYVVSLLARTVLMSLVYQPALETFSRPLAQLLKFVVMELQALTMLPVASLCLIAAFVLRPTLTSMLNREEK